MNIYDKARELGELILETEQSKRLNDTRLVFDNDKEAQKILFDYNDYRDKVQNQIQSGVLSQEEFKKEKELLNKKIQELKNNFVIADMVNAENDFNIAVNQIMDILKATITGECNTGGCSSGGCSGCKGCH